MTGHYTTREAGFTLIEVLVAIVVFSMSIYLASSMIGAMRLNSNSMGTLNASQAAQDVLERTVRTFSTTYGVLTAADVPVTLRGYSWKVDLCEGSSTSDTCANNKAFTPTSTYAYSAPSTVNILRMTVTYTPTQLTSGASIVTALELARP